METKTCRDCGKTKPISEYYKRNDLRDRLYQRCKSCHLILTADWAKRHKHLRSEYAFKHNHKPETKARVKAWRRQNIPYRIRKNCRNRISHSLGRHGIKKSRKTEELTGCSLNQLKAYLEARFAAGMSWDNYNREGWHIDHIIPCSAFDLTKIGEQKKCFHYTNLIPRWADENRHKSDKLPDGRLARTLSFSPNNLPTSS